MWHGLRNDIIISAKKYVKQKNIVLRASLPRLFFGRRFFGTNVNRGSQGQFSENICSEDDLRSRILGTFLVKFLACLPLLGFSNIYKMV